MSVTITPSTPVNDTIYTATVTVNGLKAGSTSITVTDKKGHSVVVAVTVTPTSQTFAYTGASQQFTVPTGVTQVTVDAVGASGGSYFSAGGLGAEVIATLPVTAGETLNVNVGGGGDYRTSGFNGGGQGGLGGGGASDVREAGTALTNRIIVAGGGGGSDNVNCTSTGGNAGIPNGGTGASGCGQGTGGTGATQSEGGTGGVSTQTQNSTNGSNGQLGLGGESGIYGSTILDGGGGGGGYYGGGGGGQDSGGGGGSSWVESSAVAGSVSYKQATEAECDSRGANGIVVQDGCITITLVTH